MPEHSFLSLEDILFIHQPEIQAAGGEPSIRDQEGINACVNASKPRYRLFARALRTFLFQ